MLLAVLAVSCSQGKKAEQFKALPFPDITLPALIQTQQDAAEYYAVHFWDLMTDPQRSFPSDSLLVSGVSRDDVEQKFKERLKDQDSEHNGGSHWIGTMGKTSFGNTGGNVGGVRVGGTTGYQSAFSVVGARKYRDFRDDKVIDNRQFQLAFRRLRQFSSKLDIPRTELDIDQTIDKTCNNGGCLQIVMEKPRKNAVKLLLLMDSGGTMIPYSSLLNDLFQAVHKVRPPYCFGRNGNCGHCGQTQQSDQSQIAASASRA